jgi:hypothetical protein
VTVGSLTTVVVGRVCRDVKVVEVDVESDLVERAVTAQPANKTRKIQATPNFNARRTSFSPAHIIIKTRIS